MGYTRAGSNPARSESLWEVKDTVITLKACACVVVLKIQAFRAAVVEPWKRSLTVRVHIVQRDFIIGQFRPFLVKILVLLVLLTGVPDDQRQEDGDQEHL